MAKLYVTLFGLGFFPLASGTLGSLAGVLLWLVIREFLDPWTMFLAILFLFFFSWAITERYIRQKKTKPDPPEVIIDEFIGQWVSLFPVLYFSHILDTNSITDTIIIIFLSFLLFRFFEIFKPWPISTIDQQSNSFSVLFDDVVAGCFSAIFVTGYILWIHLL